MYIENRADTQPSSVSYERKGCTIMKRVYCLYRVSTLGQVEKDDIPMQKQSCHEFAGKNPSWKIVREFSEKGVSGFKVSAKDRDAIQEIQKAAVEEKFEVLLVFMFDRIGRKEDETPFVVEWFVQHGIEVWSVNEGQQRFDTHVDKLLNYIRYWQASGESVKTSIRVKTRMGQIVKEGHFKGGVAPYGYRLVRQGRVSKKGHDLYDLEVDDIEAAVVRLIFDRYANAGMGTQTIASYLANEGILNRKGERFVSGTIRNMVKNPMYRGVLRSGESFSEPFEHLRIVDDDLFNRSLDILHQRSKSGEAERFIPRRYSTNCLLTGNIFCATCGARLVTSTAGKRRTRKDGSVYDRRYWRYICYNHIRYKGKCVGQSGYTASRIDDAVIGVVRNLLAQIKSVPMSYIVGKRHMEEIKEIKAKLAAAEKALKKATENLGTLKAEVVKAIRGESSFEPDLLNEMIALAEKERENAQQTVDQITELSKHSEHRETDFRTQHDRLVSWAEIFDGCEFDVKKMIVCQLVSRVLVGTGYRVSVELTVSMNQYLELSEREVKLSS